MRREEPGNEISSIMLGLVILSAILLVIAFITEVPCKTGKIRYRDELAAKIALANTKRTRGSRSLKEEKRAYRCPHCTGWHLTSR
jgi:hypothetical protein